MDSDNDGVPDSEDAYPNDPYRYLLGDVDAGKDIWAASCSGCHGEFVNSGLAPNMNVDPANLMKTTEQQLVIYIEENMPFGSEDTCTGQCAADVAEYVMVLPEQPVDEPDPVNGQALYTSATLNCSGCHGATGGGPLPITVSKFTQESLASKIHSDMPSGSASACVDECADDIAAYIMTW